MVNSTLVRLLCQLSSREMSRLGKFLQSPYFTQSEILLELFVYLKKCHPDMRQEMLSGEKIYRAIFPKEKKYDKHRLEKKMSGLKKLVEEFLQIEMFQKDESAKKVQYARAVSKFEDLSYFKNLLKNYKWNKGGDDFRGQKEYLEYFLIWQEWFSHPQTRKFKTRDYPLSLMFECLDGFYFNAKMVYGTEILNRKRFLNDDEPIGVIEDFIENIKGNEAIKENKTMALCVKILDGMNGEEDVTWEEIEEEFKQVQSKLPRFERKVIYSLLANSAYRYFQEKDKAFIQKLFDIYLLGLEEGILLEDGKLTASIFVNISNTAAMAEEFEAAQKFIDEYKKYLPSDARMKIPALCQAFLAFHQNEYSQALNILPRGKFFNYRFILIERGLVVRCLYEMAKVDEVSSNLFETEMSAFDAFINRTSVLSKTERKCYLDFVYMMKRILRLRMKLFIKEKDKTVLLAQLSKKTNIFSKKWLQEKIEELG